VANRTDACFIRVIGSELVQKYVGEGARMVRELFQMARAKKACIIFFDEVRPRQRRMRLTTHAAERLSLPTEWGSAWGWGGLLLGIAGHRPACSLRRLLLGVPGSGWREAVTSTGLLLGQQASPDFPAAKPRTGACSPQQHPFHTIPRSCMSAHLLQVDAIGGARHDDASGDSEVQRTMLEIVNQLDGFDARGNIKVR
jgi:SpoVK/Ycf46/Vps4 family AAA+-type ATPase